MLKIGKWLACDTHATSFHKWVVINSTVFMEWEKDTLRTEKTGQWPSYGTLLREDCRRQWKTFGQKLYFLKKWNFRLCNTDFDSSPWPPISQSISIWILTVCWNMCAWFLFHLFKGGCLHCLASFPNLEIWVVVQAVLTYQLPCAPAIQSYNNVGGKNCNQSLYVWLSQHPSITDHHLQPACNKQT